MLHSAVCARRIAMRGDTFWGETEVSMFSRCMKLQDEGKCHG